MEEITKMNETEKFAAIREILVNAEANDELIELVDRKMAQITAKNEKARARAAEKKAAGDELRAQIEGLLTDEWQTADAITEAIGDAEVTRAKVINRLSALVSLGVAEKTKDKVGDRQATVYKLACGE